jgi:4-diphosphocytidyl-2C-methyl-D-erythritol kinase
MGRNHLEMAARRVEPRLARTLDWLRGESSRGVELCGSGSTMFLEGRLDSGAVQWDVTGPEGTVRFRQTTTTPR